MRDTFFFPDSIWLINHIVQFTIIPFYFIILFLIFRNEWFDGFDKINNKINNVNIYFLKCWKTATYMKLDETLLKIATYKHDLGSTNKICKFQDATQTHKTKS